VWSSGADETGEDYFYRQGHFLFVDFPPAR
jgi:hypothetical protein